MFVQRAALRPIPPYAVVGPDAVARVDGALGEDATLEQQLDSGYRDFDRMQPALAGFLGDLIAERSDEVAQSLGYFLVVTTFLAFREAFPTRLQEIDDDGVKVAAETLSADEEIRQADPNAVLESDDVLAIEQPTVLGWVQEHVQQALEAEGERANLEELDEVYRAVLIEIIALSHAVLPPQGTSTDPAAGVA